LSVRTSADGRSYASASFIVTGPVLPVPIGRLSISRIRRSRRRCADEDLVGDVQMIAGHAALAHLEAQIAAETEDTRSRDAFKNGIRLRRDERISAHDEQIRAGGSVTYPLASSSSASSKPWRCASSWPGMN